MRRGCATVPFVKKRQRHGRNGGAEGATDRAFCKKTPKARSKLRGRSAQPTVPFAKKRQRHGRNCGVGVAADRAFCKKTLKARSKWRGGGRNRPCLLQKNAKGTVETAGRRAQPTVPFVKKRQRHGRNRSLWGLRDRAFCKKTSKARSKLRGGGHGRSPSAAVHK